MPNTIKVKNISKTFYKHKRRLWFQKLVYEKISDPNVRIDRIPGRFIKKERKATKALDDISLEVKRGEIVGLLGPNGAGKTTLAKIISTLVLPDTGSVEVNGFDVENDTVRARFSIGLVTGGERSLYWKLTPLQNLRFFGNLYGLTHSQAHKRAIELIEIFGLQSKRNELVQNLSTGQKMRVAFARALMHDPEVLILDEYNRGLDPNISRQLRNYIKQVLQKEEDKTVLLMTHEMNVAEDLCNRITLVNNGKIVVEGTPGQLMSNLAEKVILEVETKKKLPSQIIAKLENFGQLEINNGGEIIQTRVRVDNSSSVTFDVLDILKQSAVDIVNFNYKKTNLEDVFVHHTGRKLSDGED